MSVVAHNIENNIHFLTFPSHIAQTEYEDVFSEIYTLLWDPAKIRLMVDLSQMDYINSWFIGMISELFSVVVDEGGWQMVIVANIILEDMFKLVGFNDFVEIVLDKTTALSLLR